MERVSGVGPPFPLWKRGVLPLNDTRRAGSRVPQVKLQINPVAFPTAVYADVLLAKEHRLVSWRKVWVDDGEATLAVDHALPWECAVCGAEDPTYLAGGARRSA